MERSDIMRDSIETEAKFLCPPGLTKTEVSAVLERLGLTVQWHTPRIQHDTYFDTPNRTLLHAAASLRLRRVGERHIGTFKLPKSCEDAVLARQEVEWDIPPDEAQAWSQGTLCFSRLPSEVARKLQAHGVQSVMPVLTIVTRRHTGTVVGTAGFKAEVALDASTFIGERGEAQQRELELELQAGSHHCLRRAAVSLRTQLGLRPSATSKFAAGMERVG
jgi:inorganic triphosphatase YgiF